MKNYKITVLRGDGIGPEIVNECIKVLDKAGEKFGFSFDYNDQLLGGCALTPPACIIRQKRRQPAKHLTRCCWALWAALSGTTSRATIDRKRVC